MSKFVNTYHVPMYEDYMEPLLEYGLKPAEMRDDVPLIYYPEVDDFFLNGAVERTPGGRIWVLYYNNEDGEDASAVLCWSDDDGKTFSHPKFVLDPGYVPGTGLHISCILGGQLWCDPEGRLWFFYSQSLGYFDGRAGIWAVRCDNPDDEKPVWGTPRRIWHGCTFTKPLVLPDGSWLTLFTLFGRQKIAFQPNKHYLVGKNSRFFKELDEERKTFAFISRDKGETWEKLGGFVPDESIRDFEEAQMVLCKDGSLLAYMRTREGIYESISTDQGLHWTVPAKASAPLSSVSRCFLTRLNSGNLLLVMNPRPDGAGDSQNEYVARKGLIATISCDDGRTWSPGFVIEDRVSSYPDGFQTPDGRIFVTYDQERRHGRLVMAIFREGDVIARQPECSDAVFKHTIVRSATDIADGIGYGPLTGFIKFF